MKYVLVNNNQVLNGPRDWNYRSFEGTLEDDLEITFQLPMSLTDENMVITINPDTKIMPAVLIPHAYNPKIEYLHGPFWTFSDTLATGTYETVQHPLEAIKNTLKAKVAENRWTKEVDGVEITLQNTKVTLDTSREGRNIFLQAFQLGATDIAWKFPEGWLTATNAELGLCVAAIMGHVKDSFTWEANKGTEIDACTDAAALNVVDLGDPVIQSMNPMMQPGVQ